MLLFSTAALFVIMACGIGPLSFGSQAEPTATRRATRVARATFTPRPESTETPIPEPTDEPQPTEEPQPTDAPPPTAVPVTEAPPPTRAPAKPTDVPPPPATPVPQPTANPYRYGFVRHTCEHSGGSHVFVVVFSDYTNPNSQLAGARVIASYAPDSPAFGDTVGETDGEGKFDYVMAEPGLWTGTVYAWVVNSNNERISEIGGPVELNDLGPDDPGTCHVVKFYFAAGAP